MPNRLLTAALSFALTTGIAIAAVLPADCSAMKSGSEAFDTWRLTLRSEDSVMAPLGMDVTVAVPKGQALDGKVFRRLPKKSTSEQPSVSAGLPEVQGWSYEDRKAGARGSHVKYDASLRLEFGKAQGKTLPGAIALCVPKGQKSSFDKTPTAADSYAIGSFSATLP
jgi:hypothetical protein